MKLWTTAPVSAEPEELDHCPTPEDLDAMDLPVGVEFRVIINGMFHGIRAGVKGHHTREYSYQFVVDGSWTDWFDSEIRNENFREWYDRREGQI